MLNQDVRSSEAAPREPRNRWLQVWALVPLAGLAWWAGGYLFWLLDDLEDRFLPGTAGTLHLAVPLVSSHLALLVTGAVLGGVAAGLLGLAAGPGRRLPVALSTLAGTTLAVTAALLQSATRLREEAGAEFDGELPVVVGLALVVVVLALLAWGIGAGALLGRPGIGLALAVLAGLVPGWTSAVVYAVADPGFYSGGPVIGYATQWLGAAVLAAGLVVLGVRPAARLLWWPVAVAAAWLVGSFLTATVYLSPSLRPGSGLPGSLPDALDAALQVFVLASNPAGRYTLPWLVAVGAGVVLALVRDRRGSTRGGALAPAPGPVPASGSAAAPD